MHSNWKNKILPGSEASAMIRHWQELGDSVVFTNGCFDLLHRGHVNYLSQASELGNRLVIGVNSDRSVAELKGPRRPLQDQQSRMEILAALTFVDAVVLFDEDTPLKLLEQLLPDVLVKGGDYNPAEIVGAELILNRGGRVKVIPFLPGYSTTAIETRILKR